VSAVYHTAVAPMGIHSQRGAPRRRSRPVNTNTMPAPITVPTMAKGPDSSGSAEAPGEMISTQNGQDAAVKT